MRSYSRAVRAASKPQGISISCSGSTSRTASQVVSTDRSPDWPSRSQPPARRTCSGTQCPAANGGSSHSRQTTRRGGMPARRRSRERFSIAPRRSRSSSSSPTASSSASAMAPTVEMVLKMPSIDVGSRLTTVMSPSIARTASVTSR